MASWTFVERLARREVLAQRRRMSPSAVGHLRAPGRRHRFASRQALWLALAALVFCALPMRGLLPVRHGSRLSSSRADAASPRSRAAAILRRALMSQYRVAFSGEQTVLTFDEGNGAVSITQETHQGDSRYRIDYLNPPDARGRVQIADGKKRQLYLPTQHTIVETQISTPPLTEGAIRARLARIQRHYRLSLAPHRASWDGRPAYQLDLLPRHHDRPWQRLWIDTATGLILRRESYNSQGAQLAVTSWRNVRLYTAASQPSIRWTPPAGTRIQRQSSEWVTFRLSDARHRASSWAVLPYDLGKGFVFESARLIHAKGAQSLHCQYSDGLNTISLIQIAAPRNIFADRAEGETVRTLQIGKRTAQMASRGFFTVLSWIPGNRTTTMSLVGEIAANTLIAIARSLP
ncbi:MAG TPA: sigma-E factor regulatory protein RseB domain-containing protein [Chthonomonadaceae bacterium]|nr:sigma-E factor regulatory protein RseB domain-containing protein [Chthonomonadaceae bacterium]